MTKSILIVGSGFFGSVVARELHRSGHKVHVLDKRPHIGGNCYSRELPECKAHEHVYGPHIFHTNATHIWSYISQFTDWIPYVHRPKARFKGTLYSLPINLMTLQQVYGVTTPQEARDRLELSRAKMSSEDNLENWCLAQVGPDLYERLIKGYTTKHWNKSPSELPSSIIKRLPIRLNFDDNYFNDRYQGIPKDGYTRIFERLLKGVPVSLRTDFLEDKEYWERKFDHVVYSGPLDAYFGYEHGPLEYRSLRFESQIVEAHDFQGVSQINETDVAVPHTRVIEHKHFSMDLSAPLTLLTYEFSQDWKPGEAEFYPIETNENRERHKRYRSMIEKESLPLTTGGRLGEFRYYDMHQVIASALKTSQELLERWR